MPQTSNKYGAVSNYISKMYNRTLTHSFLLLRHWNFDFNAHSHL